MASWVSGLGGLPLRQLRAAAESPSWARPLANWSRWLGVAAAAVLWQAWRKRGPAPGQRTP